MFSLSYRYAATHRTFVRAVGSEFGSTYLGDRSGYEGNERVWTRYRGTKHYRQSDTLFLLMAIRYQVALLSAIGKEGS